QIVHMNRVGDDVVTEIVGLAEADAALDAAAGEPHGEASRMMITPVIGVRQRALAVNRASELAAPDHERVLKHAALFQIPDESGCSLARSLALKRQIAIELAMLVTTAVLKLDDAHIPVSLPARQP